MASRNTKTEDKKHNEMERSRKPEKGIRFDDNQKVDIDGLERKSSHHSLKDVIRGKMEAREKKLEAIGKGNFSAGEREEPQEIIDRNPSELRPESDADRTGRDDENDLSLTAQLNEYNQNRIDYMRNEQNEAINTKRKESVMDTYAGRKALQEYEEAMKMAEERSLDNSFVNER